MMKETTVSVVIPCYNAAPFLAETLQSAMAQTCPPIEVIVVDDGSEDASSTIAASFGPPVRVLRQENQGESVARNRGIEEAKGDWVAFLDADNVWKPAKLERQIARIAPGVVAVHTNTYRFGTRNGDVDVSRIPPEVRYSVEYICVSNPISPSSLLVRRNLPARFPHWTRYGEDMIYNLDLIACGEIRLVEEPLTGLRQHPDRQSRHPAIHTFWCASVEEWMAQNAHRLAPETVRSIRLGWASRLIGAARRAKGQRDWERYWTIRAYLERYSGFPGVSTLRTERIYPRWIYALNDGLKRAPGPGRKRG